MDNDELDQLEYDPTPDLIQADSTLSASFESLQRLLDSYTAMESFVSGNEHLPSESFEAAARPLMMAIMGGTDIETSGLDYSPEGFRSMASTAVQAILKALQTFFRSLVEFFSSVDLAASWLTRKVVLLERQVASSRGKSVTQATVTLGRQYKFLRVGPVFADDSLRLESELKNLKNVVALIGGDYLTEIMKAADRLPTVIRDKRGPELTNSLVGLVKGIPLDNLASKLGMVAVPYERMNRRNMQGTPPLIGGKTVFYLKSDLDTKGVRGFRFHGFQYEPSGRETMQVEATHDFNTLTPAQIGNIPTVVREILSMITRSANAGTRSKINRTKSTLDNFIKGLTLDAGDVDQVRKTVSILTYWMSTPSRALFIDSMSVCRAVVLYCNASLRTYR